MSRYLAIDCGYVDRLFEIETGGGGKAIDMLVEEYGLIGLTFYDKESWAAPGKQEDLARILSTVGRQGEMAVFCVKGDHSIGAVAEALIELEHCGCFDIYTLEECKEFTNGEDTISYLCFDTESG